jgi:hypothetical protein
MYEVTGGAPCGGRYSSANSAFSALKLESLRSSRWQLSNEIGLVRLEVILGRRLERECRSANLGEKHRKPFRDLNFASANPNNLPECYRINRFLNDSFSQFAPRVDSCRKQRFKSRRTCFCISILCTQQWLGALASALIIAMADRSLLASCTWGIHWC